MLLAPFGGSVRFFQSVGWCGGRAEFRIPNQRRPSSSRCYVALVQSVVWMVAVRQRASTRATLQ